MTKRDYYKNCVAAGRRSFCGQTSYLERIVPSSGDSCRRAAATLRSSAFSTLNVEQAFTWHRKRHVNTGYATNAPAQVTKRALGCCLCGVMPRWTRRDGKLRTSSYRSPVVDMTKQGRHSSRTDGVDGCAPGRTKYKGHAAPHARPRAAHHYKYGRPIDSSCSAHAHPDKESTKTRVDEPPWRASSPCPSALRGCPWTRGASPAPGRASPSSSRRRR